MIKGTIIAMLIMATMNGTDTIETQTVTTTAQTRVMTGNYYDYMVVETVDGNEWLLDDIMPADNPYMIYDAEYQEYFSRFQDGELVQVLFDTMGTDDTRDDVILTVRSINHRFR